MKSYKVKNEVFYPIYLILFITCGIFYYRINDVLLWEIVLVVIGVIFLLFLIWWLHAETIIVDEKGISISLVVKGKVLRTRSFLEWGSIWKVDIRPRGIVVLVPKRKTKEQYHFTAGELFFITTIYKDYFDIIQDVIDNAKEADIYDAVLRKVQNRKNNSKNK